MKCYVNALVTGTEYFSLPLQRPIIDDYIIRKMIKCSSNLDCYMQAAVLCQVIIYQFLCAQWRQSKNIFSSWMILTTAWRSKTYQKNRLASLMQWMHTTVVSGIPHYLNS